MHFRTNVYKKYKIKRFIPDHGYGEGVDVMDVSQAVLPGDETLNVDVQLVPDGQDGFIILLVPTTKQQEKKVLRIEKTFIFRLKAHRGFLTCWPG